MKEVETKVEASGAVARKFQSISGTGKFNVIQPNVRRRSRLVRTTDVVAIAIAGVLAFSTPMALADNVSCPALLTQDTRFDNDLICPGFGLTIGAPNITVNLNGHTIDGGGIHNDFHDGVTIKNGTLRGVGVTLTSVSGNTLSKLTLLTGAGIYLLRSNNNLVEKNAISNNFFYPGIFLELSDNNTIEKNSAFNNRAGIAIGSSNNNLVQKNEANDNLHGSGISIFFSDDNLVEKNSLSGNNTGIRGRPK